MGIKVNIQGRRGEGKRDSTNINAGLSDTRGKVSGSYTD